MQSPNMGDTTPRRRRALPSVSYGVNTFAVRISGTTNYKIVGNVNNNLSFLIVLNVTM